MNRKILSIGNDSKRRGMTIEALEKDGYEIFKEPDLIKARYCIYYYHSCLDMVVVNIKSAHGSIVDFCMEIRKYTDIPIIIITARDEEYGELYTKQTKNIELFSTLYSPEILTTRIKALLNKKN